MSTFCRSNTSKYMCLIACCSITLNVLQFAMHSRPKSTVERQHNAVNSHIALQLFEPTETYYDASYWEYQRPMGEMGGLLEEWKISRVYSSRIQVHRLWRRRGVPA